jgi:hypothetical protein
VSFKVLQTFLHLFTAWTSNLLPSIQSKKNHSMLFHNHNIFSQETREKRFNLILNWIWTWKAIMYNIRIKRKRSIH